MFTEVNTDPGRITHLLEADGNFPNNPDLPLVVFSKAFLFTEEGDPGYIERIIARNSWGGGWRNGIYPVHHYHSTAHEVLGVYAGSARVQFGGEPGPVLSVTTGDVIIIPAGVAHKNHWSSHDFRVVGAYPAGQSWDMNYGKEGERPATDQNIKKVPLPPTDPIYGKKGFLLELWQQE
jgi:uncharacterized protein YjlB